MRRNKEAVAADQQAKWTLSTAFLPTKKGDGTATFSLPTLGIPKRERLRLCRQGSVRRTRRIFDMWLDRGSVLKFPELWEFAFNFRTCGLRF
jgi:hypothetical protein